MHLHHRSITLAFVASDAWQCELVILQFRTLEENTPPALQHALQKCRIHTAMNLPKASGNLLTYDAGLQTGERPTEKKKVRRKASDLSQNRRRRTPMKKKKKIVSDNVEISTPNDPSSLRVMKTNTVEEVLASRKAKETIASSRGTH